MFVLASLQGEDSPGWLSEALRKVNKNWSSVDDISLVPHGTEGRPRPCSPPWRLGHQSVRSQKFLPKFYGAPSAFGQQPCGSFRHACGSPSLLVLSKDGYTQLLFSVPFTIWSQLKFVCVFNYFYLPPHTHFQTAPPKLSVCPSHSTWTSLPCPSNPCESHP